MRRNLVRVAGETGQGLVEMAIVLPLLLLLLGAIVDFGYYMYDYLGTHAGMRAAAYGAMLGRGSPGAKPQEIYTANELYKLIDQAHGPINRILSSEVTINYCCTGGGAPTASLAMVTRPDNAWGNANLGTTFADADDFVGVTITIEHQHRWLLPIYWTGSSTVMIRSRAKVCMVPGFVR